MKKKKRKHSDWPCLNHMTTPEPITMARETIYSTAIINVYWVLSWCLELFNICGNTPANRRQISTLNRSYILEEHTDNWHISKYMFNNLFYWLFIFISAVLRLCCCLCDFAGCSYWQLLLLVVHGLLIALASLVAEHGLETHRLQQLQHEGSAVVHWLSCSTACGIFPNEGSNTCPLHWQMDYYPLDHQGSPKQIYFLNCN